MRTILERLAETHGKDWLHQRLAGLDPAAAGSIDARNLRRTVRALEVILTSGRRFSEQRRMTESPYRLSVIGFNLPRPELYARIDARIEAMFADGLLDEVRHLLESGVSIDLPSMVSIGYRECAAVLRGEMTEEQARVQMRRLTRVFVRRQANWFKPDDPHIHWFDASTPIDEVIQFIQSTLQGVQ